MFRKVLLSLVVALAAPTAGYAQNIKAFVCEFSARHVAELNPKYKNTTSPDTLSFTYAALNPGKNTAQVIGSIGSSDVIMYLQSGHAVFLEKTPTGNLAATSIFLSGDPDGPLAAVHSRHMAILGKPIVSQYTGTCSGRS